MSDTQHDEAHTGPVKTPKQLLWTVIFSFVVPVFAIIGLVMYVTSANKTGAGAVDEDAQVAARLQKVGSVEIRDANRAIKSGEEVYKAQCSTCHATGVAGAPHFGDAGQWGPRLGQGFDALLNSALKGKNAMAPQGGGQFTDLEIARAVVYIANHAGGKFAEPAAPAASAASAAGDAAAAPAASSAPAAAPAASASAAAAPTTAAVATAAVAASTGAGADTGKALYDKSCVACHAAGVAGAPKLGDKAAWAPRIAKGEDALLKSSIDGLNAMPPRAASNATDSELKAAIDYMVAAAK